MDNLFVGIPLSIWHQLTVSSKAVRDSQGKIEEWDNINATLMGCDRIFSCSVAGV
ncbi:MAG TPA: hypothetical protein V6C91_18835 [Coleofasciculaceae cyanobacterium]